MRLTKKGEYALRCLISLGVAKEFGKEPVSVSELAQAERIPFKFLEGILADLRGSGFVESQRGKHGGYRLARPAAKIKIGEVVRLIDGKLAPIGCASETAYEPCSCPDEQHCGLRMLMIDVRNAIAGILDRYSLAEIVEITLMKLRRHGRLPAVASDGALATAAPTKSTKGRHADPRDGFLAIWNQLTREVRT